ncbi:biotin/lipoyl-containing protein, partial [Pacificibacter sp.]|uniref:biotin/lipoyl-containing protein n=1 Tax=Pacificibacter sp. TaxID=1917866 RepID=UPI00321B4460
PTRAEAIDHMSAALDGFEIEGIGHNLPFLSAVMDHPRFVSGNITTAFIEEEYPDGFEGAPLEQAQLDKIAVASAAMYRVAEIRRSRISGRMGNHERVVGADWVVQIADQDFPVHIDADKSGANVTLGDAVLRVESDWVPGQTLASVTVDGVAVTLKVSDISGGFRIRNRGADLKVYVRTPRAAELSKYMLEKVAADTSKLLLCPMPGLIVGIDVAVGDEIQEGQTLCTVEAMKMENILRAERKGVVSKINASAGDSLAVDEVIMEFE